MGCARKLVFSWGGNPGVGSLHRFRDAVEHGWPRPLELEEHSHAGMAAAYAAGAANLPFGVLRGYAGTDLARADAVAHDRLPVHRRAARGGAGASGPTSGSSTRSRPTGAATSSSGGSRACRRRSVLASARLDRHGRGDRRRARAAPGGGRPPGVGDRRRRRRARAARTRRTRTATTSATTLLRRAGTRSPRPRPLHGLDATSTCSRRGRRCDADLHARTR